MALIDIRTPDDGSTWSEDRLAFIATCAVNIQGAFYPIVAARADGASAILTVDTGEGGLELESGTETDIGIVE